MYCPSPAMKGKKLILARVEWLPVTIKDPASSTLPEMLVQALQLIRNLKEKIMRHSLSLNGMLGFTPAVTLTPLMSWIPVRIKLILCITESSVLIVVLVFMCVLQSIVVVFCVLIITCIGQKY